MNINKSLMHLSFLSLHDSFPHRGKSYFFLDERGAREATHREVIEDSHFTALFPLPRLYQGLPVLDKRTIRMVYNKLRWRELGYRIDYLV